MHAIQPQRLRLKIFVKLVDFPVIGVIIPGARAAVNSTETGRIAVLGTVGTIKSGAYDNEIARLSPDATVFPLACPEFVPIVESGQVQIRKSWSSCWKCT